METDRQGFATFIAKASLGRKLGAVLSWLAAAALLAVLFVPFITVEYTDRALDPTADQVTQSLRDGLLELDEKQLAEYFELTRADAAYLDLDARALEEFFAPEAHTVSLMNYLLRYDALHSGSNVTGIALLAAFCVLLAAATVTALFTMTPLCFAFLLLAGAEAALVYFLRIRTLADALDTTLTLVLIADNNLPAGFLPPQVFQASATLWMICLLAGAGVLALVGLILHFALRKKEEPVEDSWYDDAPGSDREKETGLLEEDAVVGKLVQLNTGRVFDLTDNSVVLLGKGEQAQIVIPNPVISRTHAKITCQNGACILEDMDSRNGTFVGDQRLHAGNSVLLTEGVYITLGNEIFQFHAQ